MVMKKTLLAAAFAVPLLVAGCSHPQPVYYAAPPPPPPSPIAAPNVGQTGFTEGYNAGLHDAGRGMPPDPMRHGRFRNPPFAPPAWEEYRHGFRDGYRRAYGGN